MDKILVGDIGGTSARWRGVSHAGIVQYHSGGYNFRTHELAPFLSQVKKAIPDLVDYEACYLYVSGVITDDEKLYVADLFRSIAAQADIVVEDDVLAAARATLGDRAGYVNIIGTGANARYYDGFETNSLKKPLGYLLGDEGSGSYLGKTLLRKIMRGECSDDLLQKFHNKYASSETIMEKLYLHPAPNQYLASFVPFLSEHRNDPEVYKLLSSGFDDFFNVFYPEAVSAPLSFVGSVAFYFSDILYDRARSRDMMIAQTLESAIAGLALYHKERL